MVTRQMPPRAERFGVWPRWDCGPQLSCCAWGCLLAITVLPAFGWAQSDRAETRFPSVLSEGTLGIDAELYLLDENGERVFVPDMTMEELARLRQQTSGASGEAFQFSAIEIAASASDEQADVTGTFRVQLGQGYQSADIPLRFGTCQLGKARPEIESQQTLSQFFATSGGYRWVLVRQDDGPHDAAEHAITLTGKTRVVQQADRRVLRISLPLHSTVVRVQLPSHATDIKLRDEDLLQSSETVDQGQLLSVSTMGGDFSISWRSSDAVSRVGTVEASSKTTFEITTPGEVWKATTLLSVRWYGNAAEDRFVIHLPADARWSSFPQPDYERYELTRIAAPEREGEQPSSGAFDDAFALQVENRDPDQYQKLDLSLEWEWAPPQMEPKSRDLTTAVPIPRVSEVSAHRGTIDCVYPASYSVAFTEGAGIQLIQQNRVVDAFGQRLQFGFSQQDYQLDLTFRREQSLPIVRPLYRVVVDGNKLVMTAWLECNFDANQQRIELGVVLGDWILRENEARALAPSDDPIVASGEVLRAIREDDGSYTVMPSSTDLANLGANRRIEQVWRLVAERSWTPDDNNQLEFRMPEIIRGRTGGLPIRDHGSGALIVAGENNIVLHWQDAPFRGLLSDSFSTEYARYIDRELVRKPLTYRFQSRGETPAWSGSAEFLPQATAVQEQIDVELLDGLAKTTQTWGLQVANVSLSQPRIAIREDACQIEPQFFYDGLLTSPRLIETISDAEFLRRRLPLNPPNKLAAEAPASTEVDATPAGPLWNIYQLVGAPDLLGSHQLVVVTSKVWQLGRNAADGRGLTDNGAETPDTSVAGNLPRADAAVDAGSSKLLPTPLSIPLAHALLPPTTRAAPRGLTIESDFRVSREIDGNLVPVAQGTTDVLGSGQQELAFSVQPAIAVESLSPVRIDDSWLQTAITGTERQDRYVARISTSASELKVQLPELADVRPPPRILIDGVVQSRITYEAGLDQFVVPLTERSVNPAELAATPRDYTIEIFYSVRTSFSNLTHLEVFVPEFMESESTGRFYWQLATPTTQHLILVPSELSPEWRWQWTGFWWARQSALTERELARSMGATDFTRLPISVNDYLLSGRSPTAPFRVWICARYLLWFPMGCLAILIAVLVMNLRFLRSPLAAFVLAACLITLGMFSPDLGVLMGQTAVMSLGLVGLVFVTQAAVDSRVRRRSVFSARPSTYLEGSDNLSLARSVKVAEDVAARRGSSVASQGGT